MSRRQHLISTEFPYHITARSNNRESYPLPLDRVWIIFCNYLWLTHLFFDFRIHSFVLMPNHFHMMASTPMGNLSEAMRYFLTRSSCHINNEAGRINHVHGARYFRTLITKNHYMDHVYKYIYRNPVKANLCQFAEEYKFSSLGMYLGSNPVTLPLTGDERLMNNIEKTLDWLNTPPDTDRWLEVKNALRHSEFKFSLDAVLRRTSTLEHNSL